MDKNIFENGVKTTQNFKFENLIKIWMSLINEIRKVNKFADLIKL